jgi:hypothetical protein
LNPSEYNFKAKIKTGHRITIPSFIINDWELVENDEVYVTVNKVSKSIADVNAVVTNAGD